MLSQAGHGLMVVENARSLARAWGGDLANVSETRLRDWAGLGFAAILLQEIWQEPEGGASNCVEAFVPEAGLGGTQGLEVFRRKASKAGLSVLLDFPPFWVAESNTLSNLQPTWMIHQPDSPELDQEGWFLRELEPGQNLAIARGKDPYFPPISGSAQLNPCHPGLREHLQALLARIATLCDGVWFASAMLPLPVGVEKTWGDLKRLSLGGAIVEDSPWPALLDSARDVSPDFLVVAEGYWGMEWELMGQGFNYCLDQRFSQRLGERDWGGVAAHLSASWDFLSHTLHRWKEVHDCGNNFPEAYESLVWSLFLAAPGLKLIESEFLDRFMEVSKADDESQPGSSFANALRAVSVLDAGWKCCPIGFPDNQKGFNGTYWGLLWTGPEASDNKCRHLLFLARIKECGETEFEFNLAAGVCHLVRQVPGEECLAQNRGEWKGENYQVTFGGPSPVFFEIPTKISE